MYRYEKTLLLPVGILLRFYKGGNSKLVFIKRANKSQDDTHHNHEPNNNLNEGIRVGIRGLKVSTEGKEQK